MDDKEALEEIVEQCDPHGNIGTLVRYARARGRWRSGLVRGEKDYRLQKIFAAMKSGQTRKARKKLIKGAE